MILVDYSQCVIGAYMGMSKGGGIVEEDLMRHLILNSIRMFRQQFFGYYGEIVLCCDTRHNWRKELFPFYKAGRKKAKIDSPVDWQHLYDCLNKVKDEIKEVFPYTVVSVDGAEADDIIGVLCTVNKPNVILSSDKDFIQLQKHDFVDQWNPFQRKYVKGDPHFSLHEKIVKGDPGDGIPNIKSIDDVFLSEGLRQSPITSKKVRAWFEQDPKNYCNAEMLRNWHRNSQLIDLEKCPEPIRINITTNFQKQVSDPNKRNKLFDYFVKYRLKNLMEHIGEF